MNISQLCQFQLSERNQNGIKILMNGNNQESIQLEPDYASEFIINFHKVSVVERII